MLACHPRCGLAVTPLQGLHDLAVLGQRLGNAVAQPQLQPPVGLEAVLQHGGLLNQKSIAACLVDQLVKLFVCIVVRIGVLYPCLTLASGMGGSDLGHCWRLHPACRQAGTQGLKLGHHLEHLDQLWYANARHVCPPLGQDHHQPTGLQLLQRLAHRRARDFEALHQRIQVNLVAGRHPAVDDVIFQLIAHALNARPVGAAGRFSGHG